MSKFLSIWSVYDMKRYTVKESVSSWGLWVYVSLSLLLFMNSGGWATKIS